MGGSCIACTQGDPCQPTDPCKTGTISCTTGSSVCVESGSRPAGTSCGTGKVCSGGNCQTGCWIGGAFIATGATGGSTCQICNPTSSTTNWSNNDGASSSCGNCGGSATCVNMQLGPCSKNASTYYKDLDGDGYGDLSNAITACSALAGYVSQGGDCDETDNTIYPGKTICLDSNNIRTCTSNGSFLTTACSYGCVMRECRSLATVGVPGTVTCGSTQCPTSQGCAFSDNYVSPVCGTITPYVGTYAYCDGPNDCPGQLCCRRNYTTLTQQFCLSGTACPPSDGYSYYELVCDGPGSTACPAGKTCQVPPISSGPLSAYLCM